jgi:hypothetical protein
MNKTELTTEAAKAAPAVSITGLTLGGISLPDLVVVLTLVLIILQIAFLLKEKVYKPWKDSRNVR